jgi:hypothetical protein
MSAPKIPDGPEGQHLRDKFEAYNLDPDNPDHWVLLLTALVEPGKRGRPTAWTDENLDMLYAIYRRRQREHPDKSEADICRMITKIRLPKDLPRPGGWSWQTIQRRLHDFRNPEKNHILKQLLDVAEARGFDRDRALWVLTRTGVAVAEDEDGTTHYRFYEIKPRSGTH